MILRKFGILFMSASKRKSVNTVIPITLVAENASITVANDTAVITNDESVSLLYFLSERTIEKIIAGKNSIIELFLYPRK